jgi:hypothetical protein
VVTHFCVDEEVLVVDNNLLIEVINNFLPQFLFFLNHVGSTDENSFESARISKGLWHSELCIEVGFTLIGWIVLEIF